MSVRNLTLSGIVRNESKFTIAKFGILIFHYSMCIHHISSIKINPQNQLYSGQLRTTTVSTHRYTSPNWWKVCVSFSHHLSQPLNERSRTLPGGDKNRVVESIETRLRFSQVWIGRRSRKRLTSSSSHNRHVTKEDVDHTSPYIKHSVSLHGLLQQGKCVRRVHLHAHCRRSSLLFSWNAVDGSRIERTLKKG